MLCHYLWRRLKIRGLFCTRTDDFRVWGNHVNFSPVVYILYGEYTEVNVYVFPTRKSYEYVQKNTPGGKRLGKKLNRIPQSL